LNSKIVKIPGSRVEISPASWRDLNAARQLEKICFPQDGWPILDMIGVLTFPQTVRYKATLDDNMVGFVAGEIRRIQSTAWIATISVHPDLRGEGLGSKLLKLCENEMGMPKIKLSVRVSNQKAIEMYRRNGYVDVGRWENYYKGKEDALVMEKLM
jgi:ribosomal protein S18 acetylase RimI-like enzyme